MISVIVPIYNVDDYLSTCISSIINQTYKDLEIILVVTARLFITFFRQIHVLGIDDHGYLIDVLICTESGAVIEIVNTSRLLTQMISFIHKCWRHFTT